MAMLTGREEYIIDAKRRVSIPKGMRSELGDHIFVAPGMAEGEISLLPPEMMNSIEKKISDDNILMAKQHFLRFKIFPYAKYTIIDAQGRILIPSELLEKAKLNIGDNVTVFGLGSYASIMRSESFVEKNNSDTKTLSESLMEAGI